MDIFSSLSELSTGATEALQGGVEGIGEALDPSQLGDAVTGATEGVTQVAEDTVGSAQDVIDSLNPFA